MYIIVMEDRKGLWTLSILFCAISFINSVYGQSSPNSKQGANVRHQTALNIDSTYLKPNYIAIQVLASIVLKARIQTNEGGYQLQSKSQYAFRAGLNYYININKLWSLNSGLHFNLLNTIFFLKIPASDLDGFYNIQSGSLIEVKDAYFKLAIPLQVNYSFKRSRFGFWNLSTGINLNYSGFSSDEVIVTSLADTNLRLRNIFYGNFASSNNKKPWFTFLIGLSKGFYLKNASLLSIGLYGELSNTEFIKGIYQIDVPNKPVAKGIYSMTGSCVGLTVQYSLLRANKRIRNYEKQNQSDNNKH